MPIRENWWLIYSVTKSLFTQLHKAQIKKMAALESSSEALSYGTPRPIEKTKEVITLFNELEEKIRVMMDE